MSAQPPVERIIDIIDAGISVIDRDFRILYQNKMHRDIFGFKTGNLCYEALYGRDHICEGCSAEVAFKTGRRDKSITSRATDGSTRYFEHISSPITDDCGAVTSVVEMVRDVTERKGLEGRLRKSEECLLMAQAIAHMGSWEWDVATDELLWSDEVYRIFGLDRERVRPDHKLVIESMAASDRPMFLKAIDRALNENEPFEMDYSLLRPDGGGVTVHTRGEVVFDNAGKPIKMFGTLYDITDRKRFETEAQRLAVITQQSAEGIALASLDGYITYVNNAWAVMHGYEPEELTGKHLSIFHTEEQMKEDVIPFNECLLSAGNHSGEVGHKRKDGSSFPTQMTSTVLKDGNGNIIGMFGFATDITERKQMENELRQSIKDRDMLIKEINHRVKNNLAVISSLLSLQSRDIEDQRAKDLFIESGSRVNAIAMIHDRLYKVENFRHLNFGEYLLSLSSQIWKTYAVNNGKIRLLTEIEDVSLDVDAMIPCGLIVNELITNSIKYAFPDGRDGEIFVGFKLDGKQQYLLTVRDNGIGLPEGMDISNTKSMGMKIVDALTRQLKAEVSIERTGGTVFSITFKARPIPRK